MKIVINNDDITKTEINIRLQKNYVSVTRKETVFFMPCHFLPLILGYPT